jgi:antitoxin ParD1/3/4
MRMLDEILRRRVEASLADPRPSIPAEKVFARLRSHRAKRVKAGKRSAKRRRVGKGA